MRKFLPNDKILQDVTNSNRNNDEINGQDGRKVTKQRNNFAVGSENPVPAAPNPANVFTARSENLVPVTPRGQELNPANVDHQQYHNHQLMPSRNNHSAFFPDLSRYQHSGLVDGSGIIIFSMTRMAHIHNMYLISIS